MAYLTNNQRIDLGLIGACDVPVATIQAAMAKRTGVYVEGVAAAPKAGGGAPPPPPAPGATTIKAARR